MIEIDAGIDIQKHIFAVRQSLDIQVQQRVHKMVGIDTGPHITNASLALKNRIIHRQDHTACTR